MAAEHNVKGRTKKGWKGGVWGGNFPDKLSSLGVLAQVERQF